jgi:hypothetical protein
MELYNVPEPEGGGTLNESPAVSPEAEANGGAKERERS